MRLRWLARLGAALAVLAGLTGACYWRAGWEVRHTMLAETRFVTEELRGELRVVQVTDFHNLPDLDQVDQVVELVHGAQPHLIALTGDMINTYNDNLAPVERLIRGLAGIGVPMYFVDGNHDHWSSDHDELLRLLRRHGVTTMRNEHLSVRGEWGAMTLVGTDDYFTHAGRLDLSVAGAPKDGFRFVLTHAPEILPELDRYDIDYAICGHTHGGQVRVPLIGALYQPTGQFFPRISKGIYRDGDATLFIDSGVGVTGPPYRFLNQSQVTLHRIGPQS